MQTHFTYELQIRRISPVIKSWILCHNRKQPLFCVSRDVTNPGTCIYFSQCTKSCILDCNQRVTRKRRCQIWSCTTMVSYLGVFFCIKIFSKDLFSEFNYSLVISLDINDFNCNPNINNFNYDPTINHISNLTSKNDHHFYYSKTTVDYCIGIHNYHSNLAIINTNHRHNYNSEADQAEGCYNIFISLNKHVTSTQGLTHQTKLSHTHISRRENKCSVNCND